MLAATQFSGLPVEGCPAFTLNTSASCTMLKVHLQWKKCLSTPVLILQYRRHTPHPGTGQSQLSRQQPKQQIPALQ